MKEHIRNCANCKHDLPCAQLDYLISRIPDDDLLAIYDAQNDISPVAQRQRRFRQKQKMLAAKGGQ